MDASCFEKIFVNNEWIPSKSNSWISVENPANKTVFARVPACNAGDVDVAVRAAKAAQKKWARVPLSQRKALMEKFLEIFKSQEDELVDVITKELGSPTAFSRSSQVRYQYIRVQCYIDNCEKVPLYEKNELSTIYREPIGVIGCLTPWNYPLGQIVQKVIPAILMGNTVVVKPSQMTPISPYYMAEAFHLAGFPAGVFNLVPGRGGEVGDAMSTHPMVDMISFTGSTRAGIITGKHALESVKHIALELGGKSPYVLLPGQRDYTEPIHLCFNTIFLNSGQTCSAFSRMLIPESEKDAILARMQEIVQEYVVGAPDAPGAKVGPVSSAKQFTKITEYIERGKAEGAHVLVGGTYDDSVGYYIQPTIFTDVTKDMSIAQDEIFGPVLCVMTYKDLDEAEEIANSTLYGLNAGVYGEKQAAIEFALRIDSGNVYINESPRDTGAPFGGYKQSGIGREGGVYGMLEFTQQKALYDSCRE